MKTLLALVLAIEFKSETNAVRSSFIGVTKAFQAAFFPSNTAFFELSSIEAKSSSVAKLLLIIQVRICVKQSNSVSQANRSAFL